MLFLGRINWKKGLDRLVAALAHVPAAHLVIAGNDEENYRAVVEREAAAAGVTDRVRFAGQVGRDERDVLLDRSSFLVLPSYNENFGNVVLEAMARGCPVVVTPEVGASEIVRESGAGAVIDGDPATLGRALGELLASPDRLEAMGRAGHEAVVARYTWGAVAERMARHYSEIAG